MGRAAVSSRAMPDHRSRLAEIVRSEAVLRGEFKLSSGGTSNVYLDCRRATLHPEGAVLTANVLLDWLETEGIGVDCVGGPTLGADPIVGAMVALSAGGSLCVFSSVASHVIIDVNGWWG